MEAAIATTLFHANVINTYAYDIKPLRVSPHPAPATGSGGDVVAPREGPCTGIMDWKLHIIQVRGDLLTTEFWGRSDMRVHGGCWGEP